MDKLVSLVIPVYNAGKRMIPCLDSVMAQTYKNLQIVIVDDGSKDEDTVRICKEYAGKDERIKLVRQENGGEGAARNTGVANSDGEYLCFVDADDIVYPDFVESLVNIYKEDDADLAICGFEELRNEETINKTCGEKQVMNKEQAMEMLLREDSFKGYVWNKMFKLDIIRKNNIKFDPKLAVWVDVLFDFTYMSYIDKIVFDPKPVYKYIYWDDSVSHIQNHILGVERSYCAIEAELQMEKFKPENCKSLERQMGIRYIQSALAVIRNVGYLGKDKKNPYYKESIKLIKKYKGSCRKYLNKKDKTLVTVTCICPGLLLWLYRKKSGR